MKNKNVEIRSKLSKSRTYIADLLGFKYELDTMPVRVAMRRYFFNQDSMCGLDITNISLFKEGDKLSLDITTHKAGMLIGKRGEFVSGLRTYIKDALALEIKINVFDSDMWDGLESYKYE